MYQKLSCIGVKKKETIKKNSIVPILGIKIYPKIIYFIQSKTGIMQEFHAHHEFPNAVVQISFVGTISNVLLNGLGPVARLLSAVTSLRNIMLLAVVLCTVGLEAASWATEIWHLYLSRGVLFGMGASFAFYVALSIVPQWFSKRRGIALAVSSTGTCIGAFSLPFIMNIMNRYFGSSWYAICTIIYYY